MDNVAFISGQSPWFTNPAWWAVIVALLLGVVGVFQEQIKRKFWKPRIDVEFHLGPPDSHLTKLTDRNTRQLICNTYYLRIKVKNTGNYQIEDIEVVAAELLKKAENGHLVKDNRFLPLNLKWSHTGEITKAKIQPNLFKYLDFGHLLPIGDNKLGKVLLELDVEIRPNTGTHIIYPGEYVIKLLFAANNTSLVTKQYSLKLKNEWSHDEITMLSKNIQIKEV